MKNKDFIIFKLFLSIIFFLILGILSKMNDNYRTLIHYHLYEESFNFNSIYSFYNKYLGSFSIFDINNNVNKVFNENLKYKLYRRYEDGIKLDVDDKYLVPSLSEGTVIYMGRKDYYGNVIIINNKNINIWYGNICNTSIKLYDYIEKGTYIGESCHNYIYIVYEKDGEFLDYKKFFKI